MLPPAEILKAAAGALSAILALILCWFGFDGARQGIAAASAPVVLTGCVFFAYGLVGLLLLGRAWATRARGTWKLLAALAVAPMAFMLASSFGKDGINHREKIALAEVAVLLALNVLCVFFVARRSPPPG